MSIVGMPCFKTVLLITTLGVCALGADQQAEAAERTVLCEEFTDNWCVSCSHAGPALSLLVDTYRDSFVLVQYHYGSDGYSTQWSDARWAFYEGQFTPLAIFDGTDTLTGSVENEEQQYTIYRTNHFLPERAIATDVTLTISVEYVSGQEYSVTVVAGVESGGQERSLRIHTVQVLDHWPPEKPYHRNTFKQAADAADLTISPGETESVVSNFVLDSDSAAATANVKIVAWAQAISASGPGHVYQAAIRHWPLVANPGDVDGDGHSDIEDNCPNWYNPDQANADGDELGDECDNCPLAENDDQADADEDRFGDVCDNCPALHHHSQDDGDSDGVGNVCDSCPEVPAPAGADPFGRSLGTIDTDCDVDLDDFLLFAECLSGPAASFAGQCPEENFLRADCDDDTRADLGDFAVLTRNYTGSLTSPPLYVGASSCQECHQSNHGSWLTTIHATAFDTLTASGDGNNQLCLPCHTVGYGAPSGFVDQVSTPQLVGIQCENCHGPGSNHAAHPETVHLTVDLNATLCGACHQSCHGLCGENHHPQMEQWSISKHGTAMEDILFAPEFQDECMRCHSTAYRFAPEGEKPSKWEANNIECADCHGPHGTANPGQLRLPHEQLCAQCHTTEGASPPDVPLQAQTETLHGTGGYKIDGTPLSGPYSQHWWGIPDECSVCHVHAEPYGGPEQPVNSGHLFTANVRACTPCHSEEVATMLLTTTRDEVGTRLADIARYFDPGDPLYVDPAILTGEDLDRYMIAKFDYEFVQADKSAGAHNPGYTRSLLTEVENYLGIAPWLYRKNTNSLESSGPFASLSFNTTEKHP